MSSLRRDNVKRVFLFFLIYLPVQYLFVGIAGVLWSEPWPAFALPGFKSVYNTQEKTEVTQSFFHVQYENGTEVEISAAQLFEGIQSSQLQGFIRANFSEQKEYDDDVKRWFRHRLGTKYPDDQIKSLDIRWMQITYAYTDSGVTEISRKKTKVINIPLESNE